MKCHSCGAELKIGWRYCPMCGTKAVNKVFSRLFEVISHGNQMQVKEVVEPYAKVTKLPSSMKIVVKLPGVKNAEDINIKRLEESLEIRAKAKDVNYFKVIPTYNYNTIGESKFVNELLKLVLIR